VKKFLNQYATPFTTGLFLVSAISGVALFFHWQNALFHSMHEWLSMVLLVPCIFHIWKNWTPLVGYLRRKALVLPLAICALAAVAFMVPALGGGSSSGGNPARRIIPLLTQAKLTDLAPILHTTPDLLIATLRRHGLDATSGDETLTSVAKRANTPADRVLLTLLPASTGSKK